MPTRLCNTRIDWLKSWSKFSYAGRPVSSFVIDQCLLNEQWKCIYPSSVHSILREARKPFLFCSKLLMYLSVLAISINFSHNDYIMHHLFPLIIYQALGETAPTATSTLRRVYLDFSKESLAETYKSRDSPRF